MLSRHQPLAFVEQYKAQGHAVRQGLVLQSHRLAVTADRHRFPPPRPPPPRGAQTTHQPTKVALGQLDARKRLPGGAAGLAELARSCPVVVEVG